MLCCVRYACALLYQNSLLIWSMFRKRVNNGLWVQMECWWPLFQSCLLTWGAIGSWSIQTGRYKHFLFELSELRIIWNIVTFQLSGMQLSGIFISSTALVGTKLLPLTFDSVVQNSLCASGWELWKQVFQNLETVTHLSGLVTLVRVRHHLQMAFVSTFWPLLEKGHCLQVFCAGEGVFCHTF